MRKLKALIGAQTLAAAMLGVVTMAANAGGLLDSVTPSRQSNLIPNQYIVQINKPAAGSADDGLSVPELADQLALQFGGQVLHVYEHALRGFSVRLPDAYAALLAAHPLVQSIEQDQVMQAVATQSGATWGIDRIDQRSLPLDGKYIYPDQAGAGVHVYVIDTGINPNHVEFTGRVGISRNFVAPLLGSADPNDWDDCQGHGTHVSGTAVGTTWGVAKKATIHAVRVLDCQGSGSNSAVIAGVDWVKANHVKPAASNMSLGGGDSSALDTAVKNAIAAGVTMAVAAGNDTQDACSGSPNKVPEAITVGSSTKTDSVSSFSNRGTCLDLFASGSDIVSANYSNNTGSTTMSGTSMASPHVAGAAALYLGANPNRTPQQVRDLMVADATSGKLSGTGAGSSLTGGSYGASPNKLLYVGNISGGTPPPVDNPPTAAFTFSCTGLTCSFDGSSSTDDKGIAAYSWNFGDSTSGTGASLGHTYAASGTYSVTLTVTDTVNQTDPETKSVTATAPGGNAPCTNCTKYSGTLTSGAQVYHPGTGGFSFAGGTLKGYLRGPTGADFDLYLEKKSTNILGQTTWSSVASGETASNNENVTYSAASGTYRWRVKSYSGAGSYTFWGEPR